MTTTPRARAPPLEDEDGSPEDLSRAAPAAEDERPGGRDGAPEAGDPVDDRKVEDDVVPPPAARHAAGPRGSAVVPGKGERGRV